MGTNSAFSVLLAVIFFSYFGILMFFFTLSLVLYIREKSFDHTGWRFRFCPNCCSFFMFFVFSIATFMVAFIAVMGMQLWIFPVCVVVMIISNIVMCCKSKMDRLSLFDSYEEGLKRVQKARESYFSVGFRIRCWHKRLFS